MRTRILLPLLIGGICADWYLAETSFLLKAIDNRLLASRYAVQAIGELDGSHYRADSYRMLAEKELETGEWYARLAKKYGPVSNAIKLRQAF